MNAENLKGKRYFGPVVERTVGGESHFPGRRREEDRTKRKRCREGKGGEGRRVLTRERVKRGAILCEDSDKRGGVKLEVV